MDTKEKVLQTIKKNNNPMKAGEIAETSGIDKKEVEKAIKQLVKEDKIHSPKRCFYASK